METERELLEAVWSGDRQAMRRLYDRYSGFATAVGHRYVTEQEDLRDVVQESFVKILTAIARFDYRGEGSLKAWVARIVSNCAIDWVKNHGRLTLTDDIPDLSEPELPKLDGVPPDVLNGMIARLPQGCRMVLNLFVFDGYSHREIARRLGIKENSSASQLFRAKALLADMVKRYLDAQRI